jgi:hypothetical protein
LLLVSIQVSLLVASFNSGVVTCFKSSVVACFNSGVACLQEGNQERDALLMIQVKAKRREKQKIWRPWPS